MASSSSSRIPRPTFMTDTVSESVSGPAIQHFLSNVWFYINHSDNRCDAPSVTIQEDPAIRQLFHFLATAEQQFGISFKNIFLETGKKSREFIVDFADAYIDAIRSVSKLSQEIRTHHHPRGLHPADPNQFRDVHVFTELLSTFVHYGQKRSEEEEHRPYKKGHIDEVLGFLRNYCEPFATSVLVACRLHDAGEDFDHPDGFMKKAGLAPSQKGDFFQFLCDYLDAFLPPVNYPESFRNMEILDGSGKSFPTGAQFDAYAARKLRHSDTIRDLSKIQGAIPGYAKDRYRDVNAKLNRILSESDPRIRIIMFVQYFLPKSFDTLSNVYSYFQMSHNAGKFDFSKDEDFKRRQMVGMVRNVVLRGMQCLGAQIAHYNIDDALRFPSWNQRQKYERMIKSISDKGDEDGSMSRGDIFERDLSHIVAERYQNAYKEPLPENAFEIIKWRRAIDDIKTTVQKAIESGTPPDETKFMHVIDIRVLVQDPKTAQRIKAIIESIMASFAPIIERRKLVAERRHPLVGELCSIRSDGGVAKKTTSFGYIVYSLRTLPEARRDLEGLVSAAYLNQDLGAFKKLHTFLNTLRMHVGHVEGVLRTIEDELRYLSTQPVAHQIDATRSQIYSVLKYFTSQSSIGMPLSATNERKNLFGEVMDDTTDMLAYAHEVLKLYYNYKEQIMTHMLPRISLNTFSITVDGQRMVADPHVTLPKDANPLYALLYYFPTHAHRAIESIRVNRGKKQNVFGDTEVMKHVTLLEGDTVDIQLHSDGKDKKNVDQALRFARNALYPDKDGTLLDT